MTSTGTTTADLLPVARAPRRRPISVLSLTAALLLLVAVAAAVTLTSAVIAERADVERRSRASISAERLLSDLKDAETGQRGFLLTGDERYLEPYAAALPRLRDGLASLRGAVRSDGPIAGPAAALERFVPEKLAELARTIEMRRSGDLQAALQTVESGRGRALMDSARDETATLGALADRARSASDAAIRRWLWIGTASALAFLTAGVLLLFRLRRERLITALAQSRTELSFRAALDAIPQMVWSARADGSHDYFNRRWYDFTGTHRTQAAGDAWQTQLHPEDRDRAWQLWRECIADGAPYAAEVRMRAGDGSYVWALGRALPVRDPETASIIRWYGTCTDIDELVAARHALADALEVKEVLLHEVNHRVKNSLQLVSSLLSLQSAKARTPELRDILTDARGRLSVIARLHQRLYQDGTHSSVDLVSFLRELCAESIAAVQREPATALVFEAPERGSGRAGPPLLAIDRAVPVALIVSELLTNAVKHAFPDGGGELRVAVAADGAELRVLVEDNGPGLPEHFDVAASHGVGMRVVTALVRQLGGSISARPSPVRLRRRIRRRDPRSGRMSLAIDIMRPTRAAAPAGSPAGTRMRTERLCRILVIEDEALVALEIQSGLEAAGHEIVGVADRAASASLLGRTTGPDLAVVDIRLARGDSGIDVAADLARLGIACLFVTGNCPETRGDGIAVGCLHKPFDERQLVEAVAVVLAIVGGSPAPDRLPMGMHLFVPPGAIIPT